VPINYRLSVTEMKAILGNCRPTVLLFEEQYREAASELAQSADYLSALVSIESTAPDGYENLLANASPERPAQRPEPDDGVYLIYTSGTTGGPKGVIISHLGILVGAYATAAESGVQSTDRALIVMPLYHVGGKIEQLTFSIFGATIFLERAFDPQGVLSLIERERLTGGLLGPLMIQRMLDAPDFDKYDLSSLRLVHYSSAPMPVPLLRRAVEKIGKIFIQIYGMTEATCCTALLPHQHVLDGPEHEVRRLASAGQPFVNAKVRVIREDGADCAPNEIGDVQIGGPCLFAGYWNNDNQARSVVRGGWFDTGDRGYFDDEHFLFVVDRKKDMIISGGENIYSREVEEVLATHPAVAEAAVIGVPDPQWGESVKACIVLKTGNKVDASELIEHCRKFLASYKKPKSVDFLAELPRLHNGKIDKRNLRAPYWAQQERQVS
jgi:acyl-CoA synthetase (AMP-forming)/AMP-acid ligase II